MTKNKYFKSENGSSLIAMAILIIVIGTMMNGFIFIYQNQELINKDRETAEKNQVISLALGDYLMRHGRLPCPAPINAPRDSQFYGKEDLTRLCTAANYFGGGATPNFLASRGIVRVQPLPPGSGPNQRPTRSAPDNCPAASPNDPRCPGFVKIGTIPTRNLNISDDYMVDGYGKRYVYVVTERLAVPGVNQNTDLGAVDLIDENGNSLPTQRAHVKYIFFSPGSDDRGAYDREGARIANCALMGNASENCDWQNPTTADATFSTQFFKSF